MTDPKPAPTTKETVQNVAIATTILFGWPLLLAINILLWKLALQ